MARQLAEAAVPMRRLVRTPSRAPELDDAPVFECSYSDQEASVAALTGVRTLLMVSASESVDRLDQHRSFVGAAQQAGVQHIVYTGSSQLTV